MGVLAEQSLVLQNEKLLAATKNLTQIGLNNFLYLQNNTLWLLFLRINTHISIRDTKSQYFWGLISIFSNFEVERSASNLCFQNKWSEKHNIVLVSGKTQWSEPLNPKSRFTPTFLENQFFCGGAFSIPHSIPYPTIYLPSSQAPRKLLC